MKMPLLRKACDVYLPNFFQNVIWGLLGVVGLLSITMSSPTWAAEASLLSVNINTDDKAVLQRGAAVFMNYCSGCHSLRYLRYNRLAQDLGLLSFDGEIDHDLLQSNLIFTSAKAQDPIQISMLEVDARQWFGRLPPDLSLTARERGEDWIYTYLKSFYADASRPFGVNNRLVPDVSMPNVLAPLSGIWGMSGDHSHLILMHEGEMSESQFNQSLNDLVSFLSYVAQPEKAQRYHLGYFVLLYLFTLLVIVVIVYRKLRHKFLNL